MYRFLDVKAVVAFVGVMSVCIAVNSTLLSVFQHHMVEAHEALCGGDQDFVFKRNAATNVMYWAETGTKSQTGDRRLSETERRLEWTEVTGEFAYVREGVTVLAALNREQTQAEKEAWAVLMPVDYVTQLTKATLADSADLGSGECQDMVTPNMSARPFYQPAVRALQAMIPGFQSCTDMVPHCEAGGEYYRTARALCPITCKCE